MTTGNDTETRRSFSPSWQKSVRTAAIFLQEEKRNSSTRFGTKTFQRFQRPNERPTRRSPESSFSSSFSFNFFFVRSSVFPFFLYFGGPTSRPTTKDEQQKGGGGEKNIYFLKNPNKIHGSMNGAAPDICFHRVRPVVEKKKRKIRFGDSKKKSTSFNQ